MAILLCGFMGCGKSTIGKSLAGMLGIPFIDTDIEIASKVQKSIPDIFKEDGEPYFRKIESEMIIEFSKKNAVISCGGGAMMNIHTVESVKNHSTIVYLELPFNVCFERIKGDSNRPLAKNLDEKSLGELFECRRPIYEECASLKINANDTPNFVAKAIVDRL